MNIPFEKVTIPSFSEFAGNKVNESIDTELGYYKKIAGDVEELKEIYGEKAITKTGIIKALIALNQLILTGEKEKGAQKEQVQQPQAQAQQPQAQVQKPQAQQPVAQTPAQQPTAQQPVQQPQATTVS